VWREPLGNLKFGGFEISVWNRFELFGIRPFGFGNLIRRCCGLWHLAQSVNTYVLEPKCEQTRIRALLFPPPPFSPARPRPNFFFKSKFLIDLFLVIKIYSKFDIFRV
jgi:hypothetical protein